MNQMKLNIPDIQIGHFAEHSTESGLVVQSGRRPIQMMNSDGTGTPLVCSGKFGADVIRFGPGEGVTNHTHVGEHILFVIKGTGFVEYEGVDYELKPGVCYLVASMADHAIKATEELVLIAVGNDHRPLGSYERMDLVENEKA